MDLMKTLLVYMSLVFSSSVVTAPLPSNIPPAVIAPTPTAIAATPTPSPKPTVTPTQRPTPDITPSMDYKTLSIGSKGEAVKKLQRRLMELGYLTGKADGAFGNLTKRAVERFQYYNGLSVDGVAGQRTQTILYESTEVVLAPVDVTPTPSPTPTLRPTNTPSPTATATASPTPTVLVTPSPTPTIAPTLAPTSVPTASPTAVPTESPTAVPTPTVVPTPTEAPTQSPTEMPVETPTVTPSPEVTQTPEQTPTETPVITDGTLAPVENSSIYVGGTQLMDEQGQIVPLYQKAAEEVMVPFTTLSRLMSWVTVIDNGNMDDYSVEAGGYLLDIAYDRDESGTVQSVTFMVDGLPVELLPEQVAVVENELYVTPAVLETLLSIQWNLATDAPVLNLTFTPKDAQTQAPQG